MQTEVIEAKSTKGELPRGGQLCLEKDQKPYPKKRGPFLA